MVIVSSVSIVAGQAGAGLGEQKPSAAEDTQIPSVGQESKEKSGKGLFGFLSGPNEVAKVAENPVENAAGAAAGKVEEGVESVPGPQSLFGGLFKADTEGRFGSPKEAQVASQPRPIVR